MPAIAPHSTATTDDPWDGGENTKNLRSDEDAAYYKSAFAWYDADGDPGVKSTYKFPHHMVNDSGRVGAANTRACSAGIAALNGGRGGANIPDSDRKGVYNHLAKHIKDSGKEVPELSSRRDQYLDHMYTADQLEKKRYIAYSLRELKTDGQTGVFSGYASAYVKDLQGDKIMPGAFAQSIADKRGQIPIFYNHDEGDWIGISTALAEDGKGLMLTAKLNNTTAGKDAYELLKSAADLDYRVGMSIGFIANDWDWSEDNSLRTLKQIDLMEASLTPFPAQPKAYVADVKRVRDLERYLRDAEHFSRADSKHIVRALSDLNSNSSSRGTPGGAYGNAHRLLRGLLAQSENR
jgi:HK97 family phage prohead protease